MRRLFVIFIGLFVSFSIQAQLGRSLQACWVHLDKPFYVTNDVLGFQLYLAPEFADQEMTIQAILFDPDGQAVNYSYWQNNGRTIVSGSMAIDTELSTNWYYLSFRVWDTNKQRERVLIQVPFAIYNDQQSIEPAQVSQQEPARLKAAVDLPKRPLNIEFSAVPNRINTDEPVRVVMHITDHRGRPVQADYSVSVSDWTLLGCSLAMGMDNLHNSDSVRVITPAFVGDDLYWHGLLIDNENKPVSETTLQIQIGDDVNTTRTNNLGLFFTQSPDRILQDQLHITYPDGQATRTQFRPSTGRLVLGKLFYTPAVFRYLELNRQRAQIGQLVGFPKVNPSFRKANPVQLLEGPTPFTGYNSDQNHNWLPTTSRGEPSSPSLLWQGGLQTNKEGRAVIEYNSGTERSAYRIDVVVQDANGNRGRASTIYRVE